MGQIKNIKLHIVTDIKVEILWDYKMAFGDESYDNQSDGEGTLTRKRDFKHDEENNFKRDVQKEKLGKEPLIKVLVPNDAAGAIIGKGGANLGDLKNRYGATIRISHNRESYPGTDERIVALTGEVDHIIDLHNYVIDKVADARGADGTKDERRGNMVKMILPNITAGLIKGNTEQRIEAARLVINKVASDPDNMSNTSLKYSHRGGRGTEHHTRDSRDARDMRDERRKEGGMGNTSTSFSANPALAMGGGATNLSNLAEVAQQLVGLAQGHNQNSSQGSIEGIKTTVQIHMEIPEVLVVPIVGLNGNTLREFIQFSGAKIDFTRSEIGMSHKLLTIHGDLNQTQIAYPLVNQKITQIRNELALRR